MKRLFVIPLVGVMLAALAVPVLAEENSDIATQTTDSTPITIQGKYEEDSGTATVFSVDIKWGSMKAIYAPNRSSVWDPTKLEETAIDNSSSRWRWEQGTASNGLQANEIAITNRSNAPITCHFNFLPKDEASNITAEVSSTDTDGTTEKGSFGIKSAKAASGSSVEEQLKDLTRSGFVTLNGTLSTSQTSYEAIGTLSVTLTETGT